MESRRSTIFMKWSKWLLTDSAMDGLLRRRFGVTREN